MYIEVRDTCVYVQYMHVRTCMHISLYMDIHTRARTHPYTSTNTLHTTTHLVAASLPRCLLLCEIFHTYDTKKEFNTRKEKHAKKNTHIHFHHACTHSRTHTHAHTNTRTYTHTRTHTHRHARIQALTHTHINIYTQRNTDMQTFRHFKT